MPPRFNSFTIYLCFEPSWGYYLCRECKYCGEVGVIGIKRTTGDGTWACYLLLGEICSTSKYYF